MRIVHNLQEAKTMEDIGGIMQSIYATMENNQAEYQSPMIEVEGKIDNQHITILIDFGASHSYIKSNVIEIFHLQRSKHRKYLLC
jgi:hypothetical protein